MELRKILKHVRVTEGNPDNLKVTEIPIISYGNMNADKFMLINDKM